MARKFLYFVAFVVVLLLAGRFALRLAPDTLSRIAFVPSAEFVAASGLGTAVNRSRTILNLFDPDTNPPFPGFFGGDRS